MSVFLKPSFIRTKTQVLLKPGLKSCVIPPIEAMQWLQIFITTDFNALNRENIWVFCKKSYSEKTDGGYTVLQFLSFYVYTCKQTKKFILCISKSTKDKCIFKHLFFLEKDD